VDTYDINIKSLYIRSAANAWADNLSRVTDTSDWQLSPRVFRHLSKLWGPHTVGRFASNANKQLPRYNAKWRDGIAEAVDILRLPDSAWRVEHNWCNPPWELLDDLAAKLRSSGAASSAIAPYWPKKPWFAHLAAMASETIDMPPSRDLFSPQRRLGQGGGRTFRLERRGLQNSTPPWMMLTNRQLHAGSHLPPLRPLTARDAVGRTTAPTGGRAQRYTLSLPSQTKTKPWVAAGKQPWKQS